MGHVFFFLQNYLLKVNQSPVFCPQIKNSFSQKEHTWIINIPFQVIKLNFLIILLTISPVNFIFTSTSKNDEAFDKKRVQHIFWYIFRVQPVYPFLGIWNPLCLFDAFFTHKQCWNSSFNSWFIIFIDLRVPSRDG